jgi:hypothetical protein
MNSKIVMYQAEDGLTKIETTFDNDTVQTMHHFSNTEKVALYTKIYKALNLKGVYIECDYMVTEQSVEDKLFAENARLRREMNISDGEFYHFFIIFPHPPSRCT